LTKIPKTLEIEILESETLEKEIVAVCGGTKKKVPRPPQQRRWRSCPFQSTEQIQPLLSSMCFIEDEAEIRGIRDNRRRKIEG
jgi:hypothetical protein